MEPNIGSYLIPHILGVHLKISLLAVIPTFIDVHTHTLSENTVLKWIFGPPTSNNKWLMRFVMNGCDALQNAVEQPPRYVGGWVGTYVINGFVVAWVLVVGFGFGGWASMTNFIHQIDTFGLFTKCYQCLPPPPAGAATPQLLNATAAPPPQHHPQFHSHRPWSVSYGGPHLII